MSLIIVLLLIAIWSGEVFKNHKHYKATDPIIYTQLKNHDTEMATIKLSVSKLEKSVILRVEDMITLYKLTDILTKELSTQMNEIEAIETTIEQLRTEGYKDDK